MPQIKVNLCLLQSSFNPTETFLISRTFEAELKREGGRKLTVYYERRGLITFFLEMGGLINRGFYIWYSKPVCKPAITFWGVNKVRVLPKWAM